MHPLEQQLTQVNGRLNRWQGFRLAGWLGAGVLLVLTLAALADLWLHLAGRGGRLVLSAPFFAAASIALWRLGRCLFRRRSLAAVAARLEEVYPELDTHVINRVLFAAAVVSPWQEAYLAEPAPDLARLDWTRLPERQGWQRAWLAALLGCGMLLLPGIPNSEAWSRALQRVLNPFSAVEPWTWEQLLEVKPGAVTLRQGQVLEITGAATGRSGREIRLDLRGAAESATPLVIGRLTGASRDAFKFRLAGKTMDFAYRVRAGDALPSAWFGVTVLPPPAFTKFLVKLIPPEGVVLKTAEVDLLRTPLLVPQWATAAFRIAANRPLQSVTLAVDDAKPLRLSLENGEWHGGLLIVAGHEFRLAAVDAEGHPLSEKFGFVLERDHPPELRIVYPEEGTALGPGAVPEIRFLAADDRGLRRAVLESVPFGAAVTERGTVVKSWKLAEKTAKETWRGSVAELRADRAYRVFVEDNYAGAERQRAVSRNIVFGQVSARKLLDQERRMLAEAQDSLSRLIARQQANLARTVRQLGRVPDDAAVEWGGIADEQRKLRESALRLAEMSTAALDAVKPILDGACKGPMAEVVGVLEGIPAGAVAKRRVSGQAAMDLERRILDMLLRAEAALADAAKRQGTANLLALVDGLVREQQSLLDAAKVLPAVGAVPQALPGRQDALAGDFADFVEECRRGSRADAPGAERAMAPLLAMVMERAGALKIKNDMLAAAEQLEQGKAGLAVPPQTRALGGLKELQALMNRWQVADTAKTAAQALATVRAAKETLEKLAATQEKQIEAIKGAAAQDDKSRGDFKALDAEYHDTKKEMAAEALKVATDLHALPNLPVGNELVEDLYQVYEEMKQAAGSESAPVSELGLQKEDWILDALKKAEGRLDSMEMWLVSSPDNVKRDIENFDKQELPPIALVPMPKEMQDIIGDLLDQQEELSKKADDSTGNQGSADLAAGWGIAEGEFTSYGAKGMSGNERPEHKDQDGRSGLGRAGMSDGETVEASGAIKEGDKNIENRMTRDSSQGGQVREESDAEAKATGGGKLGGFANELGQSGAGPRRDAPSDASSQAGYQDMLAHRAEALHAKASLAHLRTGRLGSAIRHMRQAEDALNGGLPIRQVQEFQRRALADLHEAQVNLDAGLSSVKLGTNTHESTPAGISAAADDAPAGYRDMVSDYFKALGGENPK